MTERDAQNLVAHALVNRTDICVVPNCGALGYEADLLRVTANQMVHEYEVKLTRSDYRANAKKAHHQDLLDNKSGPWSIPNHAKLVKSRRSAAARWWPNYFWFAAGEGVVDADELPAHVGLVELRGDRAWIVRRAKRLHAETPPDRVLAYALRGMVLRFWQERDGEDLPNPTRVAVEHTREQQRRQRERDRESRKAAREWLEQYR